MSSRFRRSEDGNILIMGALLLPVLLGIAALVLEFGGGLLVRATNQRNADIAAYAGAVHYSSSKSQDQMRAGALAAARLNGLKDAQVAVELVPSPRGVGDAVRVRITDQQSIVLGTLLGANPSLNITVESYAAVGDQGSPACILALDAAGSGVTLTGGTHVSAPKCTVASNASVSVACGPTITAQEVLYDTAPPSQGCSGIKAPGGGAGTIKKAHTADPLASNANVLQASGRLAVVAAQPAVPAISAGAGGDIEFGWNMSKLAAQASAIGCTVNGTAPSFVVACSSSTVNIGSIVINGVTVDFDTGSSTTKNYVLSGAITVSGGGVVRFPRGNFTVASGITVQSSSATFGAGSHAVGALKVACRYGDADRYSLCVNGGGTLTFGGPSAFSITAGIFTGDGSMLTLGQGSTNRFDIGASSQRNSLYVGGGASAIMGDALGDEQTFRMRGHINGGGGGSCLIISAAPQHDIAGRITVSGAVIMGAGIYTIDGVFHLGGGGGAQCGGSQVSVRGIGVTIAVSGKDTPASGACPGRAFCIGAGYNDVQLTAPMTGPTAQLAVIGPLDGSARGASFTAGAMTTTISGAFYFPTGPIVVTGGASVNGSGGAGCLQLIGSLIDLSAGGSIASDCTGKGVGRTNRKVVFVQ